MNTAFENPTFDPTAQRAKHPLLKKDEYFLGYYSREYYNSLQYANKRIVENDSSNPYPHLHYTIRPYAVFVDHNEALEKYYAIYGGALIRKR